MSRSRSKRSRATSANSIAFLCISCGISADLTMTLGCLAIDVSFSACGSIFGASPGIATLFAIPMLGAPFTFAVTPFNAVFGVLMGTAAMGLLPGITPAAAATAFGAVGGRAADTSGVVAIGVVTPDASGTGMGGGAPRDAGTRSGAGTGAEGGMGIVAGSGAAAVAAGTVGAMGAAGVLATGVVVAVAWAGATFAVDGMVSRRAGEQADRQDGRMILVVSAKRFRAIGGGFRKIKTFVPSFSCLTCSVQF